MMTIILVINSLKLVPSQSPQILLIRLRVLWEPPIILPTSRAN